MEKPENIPTLEERKARTEEQVRKSPAPGESGHTPGNVQPPPNADSRGFIPNPDWEIVNRDAQGNILEFKDRNNVRYYTPYSSNWQAGFKTSEDVQKAKAQAGLIDASGVAKEGEWSGNAPNVATETATGEPIQLTKEEANRLQALPPEERFNEMQLQGLVPKDAEYAGEKDGRIQYFSGEARKEQQSYNAQLLAERQSKTEQAIYQQSINEWMTSQVERGLAKDKVEAEQQLAEVQSGKYLAWMPDADNPEDISKGSYIPVWSDYVAQRQSLGLSNKELAEIYSGNYKIMDPQSGKLVAVTRTQYENVQVRNEALTKLEPYKEGENSYQLTRFFNDNRENIPNAITLLRQAGFNEDQITKARMQQYSSPRGKLEPVTTEQKRPNVAQEKAMMLEGWTEDLLKSGGKKWTEDKGLYALGTVSEGALGAIATLITGLPVLALKIAGSPTQSPKTAWEAVSGMGKHVYLNATNLATGKYNENIAQGNLFPVTYDTVTTVLIMEGAAKAGKGAVAKLTTYLAPRGAPTGTIVKEVSTGRIPIKQEQFSEAYADAMNQVEKLAATKGGNFTGEVPIEGTPYKLRYLKTPLQQVVGDILFHGTKDEIGAGGKVVKESLLKIAQREGKVKVGEGGIYTDPWAAIGYTRNGENPALLMLLTDASKLKSGAKGLAKGSTQSDKFIRGSREGFYGSSKVWKGELETEVVGAPGTEIIMLSPEADLLTRAVAGGDADFFTSDGGEFIPIRIGLDAKNFKPETLAVLRQPSTWYAVKLYSLYGALRDTTEAIKHPDAVLKDVSGTLKELVSGEQLIREGSGKGYAAFPGVRDVYLTTDLGAKLSEVAREIWLKAVEITKDERGSVKLDFKNPEVRKAFERNLDSVYKANARALIDTYSAVARGYGASQDIRSKFEASYLANLGISSEAIAKSSDLSARTFSDFISDAQRSLPSRELASRNIAEYREAISTPEMRISEISSPSTSVPPGTPETPRTPETPETITSGIIDTIESPRTPETPETPVTPRTPLTPETPPTPRTPGTPYIPGTPPPVIPPTVITRLQSHSLTSQPIPEGSIAFAFGKRKGTRGMLVPQWYHIPPPYNMPKPVSMSAPPLGAIRTASANPYDTIQVIGKSRTVSVPQNISIDMGISDAFISDYGRTIRFEPKGLKTDVGARLPENTRGMSIPNGNDIIEPAEPTPPEGISRSRFSKKKHVRRTQKQDDFSDLTSLRGMRY